MKKQRDTIDSRRPLLMQLQWFIRLRWIAGLVVVAGAAAQGRWLRWYANPGAMAAVGVAILGYNLALWAVMRRRISGTTRGPALLAHAWAQLLLDLGCLTLLSMLTGGAESPLLGFFVFHMVFSSLLLPWQMAYAGAGLAMLMLGAGLWATRQWSTAGQSHGPALVGWMVTLLMTVWLANGITQTLRRQRRRLVRRNRRIRAMSRKLRRQQRGMIQNEKMAAAGRMASGVAHEIANPLASMDGLLQLMERRPERLRPDAIATLREQVARINQIVRRMTEFAHPGDGEWRVSDLNAAVEKALGVVGFDPRMKGVAVERRLDRELPNIRMLGDAVQQIVINLVINALDAMEQVERPRLVIRTGRRDGFVFIEVADNGMGIAPEQQRRLFEPFFTTKPVGKGTGLGLSISYSLARTHDGEIVVESHKGRGTCFTVRLPVGDVAISRPQEDGLKNISDSEKIDG